MAAPKPAIESPDSGEGAVTRSIEALSKAAISNPSSFPSKRMSASRHESPPANAKVLPLLAKQPHGLAHRIGDGRGLCP